MRHRRLVAAVLLGACLLLVGRRSPAQSAPERTVIATSVPVTSEAPAAPALLPPNLPPTVPLTPRPAPPAPAPGGIQQAAFVPGAPVAPAAPAAVAPEPRLPANGLAPVQSSATPPPAPPPSVPPTPPPSAPSVPPSSAPMAPPSPPPAALPATGLVSGPSAPAGPAAPPAAPAGPTAGDSGPATALVSVEVTGPERVVLGQPLAQEIVVRNTGMRPAAEVRVEEALPAGARVLRSEPPGAVQGDRVGWDLGTLEAGTTRHLKVEVQPAAPGDVQLRPAVTFAGVGGMRTHVVRPQFAVEMTADHDRIPCNGKVTFTIRVTNQGDAPVTNIKLFDNLPANLQHPAGRLVGVTRFGDLGPGQSRSVKLETTAVQAGRFRNEVTAQADGGVEGRAAVEGEVTEPTLTLRLDGPKRGTTGRDLDFNLEVSNPGPSAATKVHLIQAVPPGFEGVAASTGGSFDAGLHAFMWTLADLAPGQRQTVTLRVRAAAAGDWPLYTSVLADNIAETRISNVLHIEGAAALRLEAHAREDRLNVGEETVYELHVFNQGDAPCTGVRLTATLPDEVTPLDAQGPTAGQVSKQQVQFPALAQLPPHGDAVYRVRVRGQRPGKARVRVELSADKEKPAESDLSVQVNGGPPPADGATQTVGHTTPTPIEQLR